MWSGGAFVNSSYVNQSSAMGNHVTTILRSVAQGMRAKLVCVLILAVSFSLNAQVSIVSSAYATDDSLYRWPWRHGCIVCGKWDDAILVLVQKSAAEEGWNPLDGAEIQSR